MNKKIKELIVTGLLLGQLSPLGIVYAEGEVIDLSPDASPTESVTAEPAESSSRASTDSESSPDGSSESEEAAEDTESESEAVEAPPAADLHLDPSDPLALVDLFKGDDKRYNVDMITVQQVNETQYSLGRRLYLKDQGHYLIADNPLGQIPYGVTLEVAEQKVKSAYTDVSSIFMNAETLLNDEPDVYRGTAIEKVHQYGQDHHEELKDAQIVHEDDLATYEALYHNLEDVHHLLIDLLSDWLVRPEVQERFTEVSEGVLKYELHEAVVEDFVALFEEVRGQYPELDELYDILPAEAAIHVNLDFNSGQIVVELSPMNQSESGHDHLIQYFMTTSQEALDMPEAKRKLSEAEFNELLGFDYQEAVTKLNAEIKPRLLTTENPEIPLTEESESESEEEEADE